MNKKIVILFTFIALFILSCTSDKINTLEKIGDKPLELETPSNFPELQYDISQNPPTEAGFELGKKLFYDGKLAIDNVTACGACHLQQFAFTHHGHTLSHGVNGSIGFRNAQPLHNLAYLKEFTWDGAAIHLDLQPIIPITNELEMGETFQGIITKLEQDDEYRTLFARAFENNKIDSENILKALSQFMIMMQSSNSKYDKYVRGELGGEFSDQEKRGLQVFTTKCSSCHGTELFTDQTYRNNGLSVNPRLNDKGRERVTGLASDNRKFRVPTLRNIEYTFPYMHDGRFANLYEVIEHYRSGIEDSPTLDPLLKQNNRLGMEISDQEEKDLIKFLQTLTDYDFIEDERFKEF